MIYVDGPKIEYPVGPGTLCTAEEGKTRQSEAQQADINWIVKRYEQSMILPAEKREGVFKDISEMPSFQGALNQLRRVDEYFMSLPPHIRLQFNNESAVMLDAWANGDKAAVFAEIGLLEERVDEEAKAAAVAETARAAREARICEIAEGFKRGREDA